MNRWSTAFPGAFVSLDAELGKGVEVAPGTVVGSGVRIGDGCRIGFNCILHENSVALGNDVIVESFCELGHLASSSDDSRLLIGSGSHIRSHSVFYRGSSFGEGLVTGHHVTVRENTRAGKGLQLGTLSDVQGHCTIGDHVKTHSSVHICQTAVVEDYVRIYPYVVLTNDPHPPSDGFMKGPTVRRYAVIATHSCIMPALEIGEDSLVAAAAMVTKDVPPRTVVGGVPAKVICGVEKIRLKDGTGRPAYPWRRHFHRGYPEEIVRIWEREFKER